MNLEHRHTARGGDHKQEHARSAGAVFAAHRSSAMWRQVGQRADATDGVAPARWEVLGLVFLIAFYLIADELYGRASYDLVNVAGPVIFTVIMLAGVVRMMRANPANIWAALMWFRVSTAIYFGIGSMIHLVLNDTSRLYIASLYPFSDAEVAKLNLVVAGCMLAVLVGAGLVGRSSFSRAAVAGATARSSLVRSNDDLRRIGLLFLIIGGAIKYLIVFPFAMGWTSVLVDGVVSNFSALSLAGIYLLTLWGLRSSWLGFLAITMVLLFEMTAGLLLLSKTEILLPALVYCIAILQHRPTLLRLGVVIAVVAFIFQVLAPLVGHGRDVLYQEAGGAPGLDRRLQIVASYFEPRVISVQDDELQGSLMRFSYVNAGTFALALHDRGQPGNSLENAFAVLIPRMLWPDKPIFNVGQEFDMLATGLVRQNSISPGLFAEAYWNFGWAGIPLLMLPFGILLALYSRYALRVIDRGEWILLPVLFICMKVGTRADGHYVADAIGTAVIIVGMHWVIVTVFRVAVALRLIRSPVRTALRE